MEQNNDCGYLWILLMLLLFAAPDIKFDVETIKANLENIKQVLKEKNIDFNSMNLDNIKVKSDEIYKAIKPYLSKEK